MEELEKGGRDLDHCIATSKCAGAAGNAGQHSGQADKNPCQHDSNALCIAKGVTQLLLASQSCSICLARPP